MQGNKNPIIIGSWLFMLGCIVLVVFAGLLRSRLAAADGTTATIAYTGAVMMAVLRDARADRLVSAINADSVSPASAGAFHHIGDIGFIGAELSLTVFLGAIAVLAFRHAVLPRWWAALTALVAVVALIGPIGWAALVLGFPVWVLVTPWLVGRTARRRAAAPVDRGCVAGGLARRRRALRRGDVAEPVAQVLQPLVPPLVRGRDALHRAARELDEVVGRDAVRLDPLARGVGQLVRRLAGGRGDELGRVDRALDRVLVLRALARRLERRAERIPVVHH